MQFGLREYRGADPHKFWSGLWRIMEDFTSIASQPRDPFAARLRAFCVAEEQAVLKQLVPWLTEAGRQVEAQALTSFLSSLSDRFGTG